MGSLELEMGNLELKLGNLELKMGNLELEMGNLDVESLATIGADPMAGGVQTRSSESPF